jgi:hypothetical protein
MNQYVIVNLRASVRAAAAGLVFFTRDGSITEDLERAGIWTEGEVNSDLDHFDNGHTTRAVLVSAVPKLLAEAAAGEAAQRPETVDLVCSLSAAIESVHSAFGAPGNYGYATQKGRALAGLYEQNQKAKKHIVETYK